MKGIEIENLKSQSEKLRNELRSKKELMERMNFEEIMRSPSSSSNKSRLGHIKYQSSNEGESSLWKNWRHK